MKINNIDCCKPKRRLSFQSESRSNASGSKKITYKHYWEMSQEDLYKRSVVRAGKKAEKSGKMRIFRALPLIGTSIIGASLALTQPGKTTSKIAAGLGFLVFEKGLEDIYKGSSKAYDNADETTKAGLGKESLAKGGLFALTGATMLMGSAIAAKGGKNIFSNLSNSKTGKVIVKEVQKLKDEINTSKIGNILENTVDPFFEKHKTLSFLLPLTTMVAASLGVNKAQGKLASEINKTFTDDIQANYIKGRKSQMQMKAKFDKIDAKEI